MEEKESTIKQVQNPEPIGVPESVCLLALLMALVALSVDAILPALKAISSDFGIDKQNENVLQLPVTFLAFGLGIGQLFFGPLSDVIGRKNSVYIGMAVFLFGNIVSIFAPTFQWVLVGRVIQGVGVASPRVNAVSIIRDLYKGAAMARIMSWILTIFIIVPMVAPGIGQITLLVTDWRGIFWFTFVCGVLMVLWFGLRQHETLKPENVRPFTVRSMASGFVETFRQPVSVCYLLCAGFVSGGFFGFLSSSKQMFLDLYGIDKGFAFCFAWVALFAAIASTTNGFLVRNIPVHKLTWYSGMGLFISASLMILFSLPYSGNPPFFVTMAYLAFTFFCAGIMFANLNAMAMEPLGHIAGVGSAVVGSVSTTLSAVLGLAIGAAYNKTMFPLLVGFAVLNLLSLPLMAYAEHSRKWLTD